MEYSDPHSHHDALEHHDSDEPATEHGGHATTSETTIPVATHEGHVIADFRRRFIICSIVTTWILILSPSVQEIAHIAPAIGFPGATYLLFLLASFVYFYGG